MEAKRYYYSTLLVADAVGRKAATVRCHIRDGVFDMDNLLSVARYIAAADLETSAGRTESLVSGDEKNVRAQE